jgi:putative membrane protein
MTAMALLLAEADFGEHMGDWGPGWWIVMMVMMVAFWGLVIVGAVWLVRLLAGRQREESGRSSAAELLEHRLASGEISPEEYRRLRAALSGSPGPGADKP